MTFSRNPVKKLSLSLLALGVSAGIGRVAYSQDQPEQPATRALEEVTVTGTRIRRSDDFSESQPTTVLTGDFLDSLGVVNVGDAMKNLPENVPNATPTSRPNQNFFNGSNLINLRGLNPYYGTRTLTLVDSKRHVPTSQADIVDLNFIPTILIDQVEIVTGGASASYGSGAIAGVNNILLDHRLEGGKVQVDFGGTGEGDGDDEHYGVAWGTGVGDNGHFIIGYEGQEMDAIMQCGRSRDWCAQGTSILDFGTTRPIGTPRYRTVTDVRQNNISSNGVIRPPTSVFIPGLGSIYTGGNPCLGTTAGCVEFNASGTATEQWQGRDPVTRSGGDGNGIYDYYPIRTNVDRDIGYLSYEHQITDALSFSVEASHGRSTTLTPQRGTGSVSEANDLRLRPDNAYLLNLGAANPCAGFALGCTINKEFADQIQESNLADTEVDRFVLEFDGEFGDSSWNWNAYYQYGESDRVQAVQNTRHNYSFLQAIDAVHSIPGDLTSPIVCRATRDGPNNPITDPADAVNIDDRLSQGCVPLNMFGTGNATPEALAYAFGRLYENTVVEQHVIEGVASGEIAEGWGAGPVLAAFGMSFRAEEMLNLADPEQVDFRRADYGIRYGESFGGDVDVLEYFGEVDIPVTERFDVQFAARRSEYENTAGLGTLVPGETYEYGLTTWKTAGTWQPTDLLAFRSSISRDSRAPNFRDLYFFNVTEQGALFGWCNNPWTGQVAAPFNFGGPQGDGCTVEAHGGLGLAPEESDTATFGIILTPPESNLRLALDYYKIELNDAIVGASQAVTVDACYQGDQAACALITFAPGFAPGQSPTGLVDITSVKAEARNFKGYEVEGIDVTTDWGRTFDFGTVSMRFIASRALHQLVQPEAATNRVVDIAGVTGTGDAFQADFSAAPKWNSQWITSFSRGSFVTTLQARFISSGKINASGLDTGLGQRLGPEDDGYAAALAVPAANPAQANNLPTTETNRLPSHIVWGLNGSYTFEMGGTELQLFGSVNNLFDKDPPQYGGGTTGTNPLFFDTVGRNYRVGLRLNF